jgi:hypothetical protein
MRKRKPGKRQRIERAAIRRAIRLAEESIRIVDRLQERGYSGPAIIEHNPDFDRVKDFMAGFSHCLNIFRRLD